MTPREKYGLIVFLAAVAAVYIFAFGGLVRLLLEKSGVLKTAPSILQIRFRRLFFALALFGLACFAYAYFVEPYWLDVRRVEIKSAKIPAGKRLRVVHISDLHSDPAARLEEKLPSAIAAEKPDLIVYTGDSVNSPEGLPVFRKCLTELARVAPVYVVKGNWDVWFWKNLDLFGATGARELNGAAERLEIGGVPVWLAGAFVGSENKLTETLSKIPKNEFSLFLFHYPDLIEQASAAEMDLYCAGHTHGGQVAMPFYGALVTFSKFGKKYEGGTYEVGKTRLNVNRGIGMEGGNAPRVRFCARPEITVIDIMPE
ncbi:MAG TPA: metallophosphoesterase [Pyrinomonadaceae bacterium]|jgi:predicted MPP superfamily phosphohydrolase